MTSGRTARDLPLTSPGKMPALINRKRTITFADYHRLVAAACRWLTDNGIERTQRIGILAENSTEYVIALLALIYNGAVACPINTRYPSGSTRDMLASIGCRTVIGAAINGFVQIPLPDLNRLQPEDAALSQVDPDQDATIIFTSGTSSLPKAVLHTYGNHYFSALGSNTNIALKPGDRWLLSLQLYHVGGLGIIFRCLLAGAAVVLRDNNRTIAEEIEHHHITHLSLVPAQLSELLKSPPSNEAISHIKCALVGGSFVPQHLITEAVGLGIKIRTTYGSTEMASQVTTIAMDDPLEKLCTSGRLLKHRELKISDGGEILVRGKTLFKGYVTSSGLQRNLDTAGWFHTGDLGNMDSDGYLTVTGRIDNMFISGGENVYPEEIEAVIRSIEGIDDVVVVPVDDARFGKRPVAVVKYASGTELTIDGILESLREKLPGYKVPVRFLNWPEEQRESMKADRAHFRSLAAKQIY